MSKPFLECVYGMWLMTVMVIGGAGCSNTADDDRVDRTNENGSDAVAESTADANVSETKQSAPSTTTNNAPPAPGDDLVEDFNPASVAKAQRGITMARQLVVESGGFDDEAIDGLSRLYARYPWHEPTRELYARGLEQMHLWEQLVLLLRDRPEGELISAESMKLASALLHLERYDEAADAIEAAIVKTPSNLDAVRIAATAYVYAERFADAADILDRHWDELVAARWYDIYYLRGVSHLDAGEHEQGVEQLRRALSHVPEHSLAHEALGNALIEFGQQDLGEKHVAQAAAIRAQFTQSEMIELHLAVTLRAIVIAAQNQEFDILMNFVAELLPYARGRDLASLYEMRATVLRAQGQVDLANQSAMRAAEILMEVEAEEAAAAAEADDSPPGSDDLP